MDSVRARRSTTIFAKQPAPGRVKTRLAPSLGPAGAARLAEGMLRDTVARCLAGEFRTLLAFAPAEAEAWFRASFPEVREQVAQVGAGLGERLAHHFAARLADAGTRTAVVVGSDQPLVPLARIEEAHRALESGADCVLGPDPDGGYYLVGLARSAPELFLDVPFSSAGTYAATLGRARELGLALAALPAHGDVDTPADLAHLRATIAALAEEEAAARFLRHTRAALLDLARLDA